MVTKLPKIFELEPHIADLIAAGEVVERPASVVKELVENSIDAGAGIITVEINAGGMTYIRVTDNGCGIAPGDAETAFLRHATSKLRDAEGLEAIGTLGFRGEALAAVASVSRIDMLTREQGAGEGVSLSVEAGTFTSVSPAGCPEGTTIVVRDLFFNTPARQKFVKSDRSESSAVASAVLRCALSHPEVSVRFIRDGRTEFHTPGDSRADSCIYSLFGREFSAGLIRAESKDETISVTGFVSAPSAARGNRSYQYFFVNGRPVQSRTLQAALEQAYANTLPSGRFPSCMLYIATRLGDVDVNVHPAKTEIKFISDKQAFDGVYYAALGAVAGNISDARRGDGAGSAAGSGSGSGFSSGREQTAAGLRIGANSNQHFKTMQVDDFRRKYSPGYNKSDVSQKGDGGAAALSKYDTPGSGFAVQTPDLYGDPAAAQGRVERFAPGQIQGSAPGQAQNKEYRLQFRVIGEALKTYIIVEYCGSIWLIDKHAAHERIHFDALRSENYEPMAQSLITPVICRHGHEDSERLLENAELLEKLGFSVESFGEDAIAVRRIPSEIDLADAEPILSEICRELEHGGTPTPARRDAIYSSIACKAAIKSGKSSGLRELEALAARVLSGEIAQCPHGRPVAVEMTKTSLDRSFKRI